MLTFFFCFLLLVMQKSRESRKLKKLEGKDDNADSLTTEGRLDQAKSARKAKSKKASIFVEETHQTKAEHYRLRQAEKLRKNEEQCYTVQSLFEKLSLLDEKIGNDLVDADRPLIREYMKCAQELWEDFSSTSAFYPNLRVRNRMILE